jgi:transcriptional regulator with XRE-family HTH domain
MLIQANQIRAARGLLDWTVGNLAEKSGIGASQVSAIENGKSAGSIEALSAIVRAFDQAGIELMENGGVRPREARSRIYSYQGYDGFCAFFDEVYETARNIDRPDLCVSNVEEHLFEKWLGAYDSIHMSRMAKLKNRTVRALLKDTDVYTSSSAYTEYRWVSEDRFAEVSFYLYGDKAAFIEFLENDVVVTVVDSAAVTLAQRKMFELSWNLALTDPPIKNTC